MCINMSSKASFRNQNRDVDKKGFRKIRQGFRSECGIMKTNKVRYYHIKFNQLVKIAESGVLGVSKDDLKKLMKEYIESDKKPEI